MGTREQEKAERERIIFERLVEAARVKHRTWVGRERESSETRHQLHNRGSETPFRAW